MSVPNFSSLAGLEVAGKFVVGWGGWMGWNMWLLCLTPTLVALELSCVGFWQLVPNYFGTKKILVPNYIVTKKRLVPNYIGTKKILVTNFIGA